MMYKSFARVFCSQVLALALLAAVAHSRPTNEAGWQEDPTQSQAQPVITQTKQVPSNTVSAVQYEPESNHPAPIAPKTFSKPITDLPQTPTLVESDCHVSCAKNTAKGWVQKCALDRCSACEACTKSLTQLIQSQVQGNELQVGGLGVHISPKLVVLFPLALGVVFGGIYMAIAKA